MNIITKILVPTDLSDLSLMGLDYAQLLATQFNAHISLLHVICIVPEFTAVPIDPGIAPSCCTNDSLSTESPERFLAKKIQHNGNITYIVRRGEPYREIITFAQEEGVDLIVMATHGRTGLAHVFLGSVAEKVVHHSTIPVLTVKPSVTRQ